MNPLVVLQWMQRLASKKATQSSTHKGSQCSDEDTVTVLGCENMVWNTVMELGQDASGQDGVWMASSDASWREKVRVAFHDASWKDQVQVPLHVASWEQVWMAFPVVPPGGWMCSIGCCVH